MKTVFASIIAIVALTHGASASIRHVDGQYMNVPASWDYPDWALKVFADNGPGAAASGSCE